MKITKIKRYRMPVSRKFPITHPRAGEQTYFIEKTLQSLGNYNSAGGICFYNNGKEWAKIHTIRQNVELWEKRVAEVQRGEAVIELFYWKDRPYQSPQVVFATLDKDSGVGTQKLKFIDGRIMLPIVEDRQMYKSITLLNLTQNDGLSLDDFKSWFRGYDLSNPMVIIHFTKFRY